MTMSFDRFNRMRGSDPNTLNVFLDAGSDEMSEQSRRLYASIGGNVDNIRRLDRRGLGRHNKACQSQKQRSTALDYTTYIQVRVQKH